MTTIADLQALSGIPVTESKQPVVENSNIVRIPLGIERDEWEDFLMSIMSRMQGSDKLEDGWDHYVPGIIAEYVKERIRDHSIVDVLAKRGAFDRLAKRHT